ncbi:MAG: glycosyltransferase family 39 protein, partial [Anaerolineae bacterium]|nr:glycosyltransferase family 39 protein [Anaerolineae bacterium]
MAGSTQRTARLIDPVRNAPWRIILLIVGAAALARGLLIASGTVSFHADEAVVGLMARHILAGERPTFFYGQAYMGSLDAWIVAVGFRLLGESVLTIRLVQSGLYLLVVAVGCAVSWRLTRSRVALLVSGLMLAIPTPNTAVYTTASLGGYNEALLLGGLTLWLGFDVAENWPGSRLKWGLLGLVAGIGWWAHGLIVIYALPVGLLILLKLWRSPNRTGMIPYLLVGLGGFVIGSAPWWSFDLATGGAAMSTFLRSQQTGTFAGIGIDYVPPGQRAVGLVILGIPALMGMRFPWSVEYFAPTLGVVVLGLCAMAVWRGVRRGDALAEGGRLLTVGMLGGFAVIFVASSFGADPTGRYLLPLNLPLAILVGGLVDAIARSERLRSPAARWGLAVAVGLGVIIYQAAGQMAAGSQPPGFTTQFDPISHLPNDFDAELIDFLEANDLQHGYTNYW